MRTSKTAKAWKTLEDELQAGRLDSTFASPSHGNWEVGGRELTTAALAARLPADTASLAAAPTISNPTIVNAFDTTAFGNPDPSGLAFIPGGTPGTGTLLVSDSEVDETPFFATNNLFYYSLSGTFDHSLSLESFTFEPTGLAYDPLNGHLFVSDDNADRIYEVDAGSPGVMLASFSVRPFATDAEDVAFDPVTNHVLVIEGDTAHVNPRTIFEMTTDGATVQTISLTTQVPSDLEAIAYDPVNQVFYVTGGSSLDIYVVSRDGKTLLDTITVLESLSNTLTGTSVHPKGLLLAPSSDPNDDPGVMALYVADYGNDQVMDGRIYELQLNGPAPAPSFFTTGDDIVDFNQVVAGGPLTPYQYDAMAGNDTVILPTDAATAAAIGYNPVLTTFRGGDGNDTITGGSLNDTVNGDGGNDVLNGGAGNDRLLGGASADTLSGGLGDDHLDGGSNNDIADYSAAAGPVAIDLALGTATGEGNDTLVNIENATGSGFDDSITGNTLANVLNGGGGNDTLHGADGNDTLVGGSGRDTLFGDSGHDTLKWDSVDSFDGGAGFDTLDANVATADTIDLRGAGFVNLERILTGSGGDAVTVSLGKILSDTADHQFVADLGADADTLTIDVTGGWTATAPNSTLGPTGTAAGISVAGMTAYTFTNGATTVTVFSNAETVQQVPAAAPPLFTSGDDTVDFNAVVAGAYLAGSQYDALGGNDTVTLPVDAAAASNAGYDPTKTFNANDGNDHIIGGTLNDTILGGNGNDILEGGDGNDILTGGNNSDKLFGGAGNDTLSGGGSSDTLVGGLGDDLLDGGASNDLVDYSTSATAVTVDLALGVATGEGNDKLVSIENVTGSGFNDTITGNSLANLLVGGGGNDTLHGGDGNDTLTGGAGLDHLFGDAGHDTLKWDSADAFDGGLGFDTLDANLSSADSIDLRGANFANLERVQTGSGKDTVTLSLNDVLSDTADHQFVADLGSSSPDTLNIDTAGGWAAAAPDATLGPTGIAAGVSISGMTAYTFSNGVDTVTIFSNAEVVHSQALS
jgi:Ca2+-binding RTX toxin-like protein